MTTEVLKIHYKTQIQNPDQSKIINHKKSHELRLIRPQTQHKNREHMYLKFLTPLTTFVEKTVNLHGFKYIYKQTNKNLLLSQCGS